MAGRDAEDLGFLTLYLGSIKQSIKSKYMHGMILYTLPEPTDFVVTLEQMDSGYKNKMDHNIKVLS